MRYEFLILSLLSVFICKCTSPETEILESNGNKIVACHIDRLKNTADVPLSEFTDNCIMITLDDSTSDAFIKNIAQVNVSENFIGIRSRGMPYLPYKLFTKDGRFLRNIGTIGKGPAEYQILSGSQIDENAKKIYLAPFPVTDKIYVYDLEGNHLPDVKLNFKMRKCKIFVRNDTIHCFSLPFLNDSAVFLRQTLKGEVIDYVSPNPSMVSKEYSEEVFSNHNTNAYEVFLTTSKILMHYDPESHSLVPKLVLKFKDEGAKELYICREWPDHYYGWLKDKGYFLINKHNHDASYVNILNDYYGNINVSSNGSDNGYFIYWISGIELLAEIDNKMKTGINDENSLALTGVKEKVLEEDWVLFTGKLKNSGTSCK